MPSKVDATPEFRRRFYGAKIPSYVCPSSKVRLTDRDEMESEVCLVRSMPLPNTDDGSMEQRFPAMSVRAQVNWASQTVRLLAKTLTLAVEIVSSSR